MEYDKYLQGLWGHKLRVKKNEQIVIYEYTRCQRTLPTPQSRSNGMMCRKIISICCASVVHYGFITNSTILLYSSFSSIGLATWAFIPAALNFSKSAIVTSAVKAIIGIFEFIVLRM